jgi:hypothetical protein
VRFFEGVNGRMEEWKNGTPIAIGGNVEALAEILLWREKNEKLEQNPVGFGNLNLVILQG